jgi:hypothetical protein
MYMSVRQRFDGLLPANFLTYLLNYLRTDCSCLISSLISVLTSLQVLAYLVTA